ncbi:hypothetical protein [Campylobacter devanensis]|nr:hypothetical protein [Campylobacter sp. P0098]
MQLTNKFMKGEKMKIDASTHTMTNNHNILSNTANLYCPGH